MYILHSQDSKNLALKSHKNRNDSGEFEAMNGNVLYSCENWVQITWSLFFKQNSIIYIFRITIFPSINKKSYLERDHLTADISSISWEICCFAKDLTYPSWLLNYSRTIASGNGQYICSELKYLKYPRRIKKPSLQAHESGIANFIFKE